MSLILYWKGFFILTDIASVFRVVYTGSFSKDVFSQGAEYQVFLGVFLSCTDLMIHLVTGSLALLRHTSWWEAGAGLEVELSTIASSALPGHADIDVRWLAS